jgi:glutaminyl-tRNA synthetase
VTYLRFDDTNPEVFLALLPSDLLNLWRCIQAEKQEYIDSIERNVAWLGNKAWKITHSSDYFQTLYELAVDLIRRGKAYVCHQTGPEIKASRDILKAAHIAAKDTGGLKEIPRGAGSPYRDTSVEENLAKFEDMRRGMYNEGEAFLRMKMDLCSPNPSMWDHCAYRVKFTEHPKSKCQWCIYPTYDYTHCIVDSLENVTHSLCTLEFSDRQASDGAYYWLLDALDLYKPVTWEYSRCNLTYNVMSKRKLNRLVTKGYVNGWDDPRLLTLDGLRRRGYTPASVNTFCNKLGVTKAANTSKMELLESVVREELNTTAPRRFAVIEPLKVTLLGGEKDGTVMMSNHPAKEEMGKHAMPINDVVYIERSDFREVDEKSFFGLAPGKEVHLKYGPYITCKEVKKNSSGEVVEVVVNVNKVAPENREKPEPKVKGHLHWVSAKHCVEATMNLYSYLFLKEKPEAKEKAEGGEKVDEAQAEEPEEEEEEEEEEEDAEPKWVSYLNPESLVVKTGLVEPELVKDALNIHQAFQFERVGYFAVDPDSTRERPVFNRVVTLKESKDKKAL